MADRFVVRNSQVKLTLLLAMVLCISALVAAPAYFGLSPKLGSEWIRWPVLAFFGYAAIILAIRFFDDRAQIVVTRDGILWRLWSDTVIPWSAISRCRVEKQHLPPVYLFYLRHVCLYLHDPTLHPPTRWRARLFGRGANLGFGDITVSMKGMEGNTDTLMAAIRDLAPESVEVSTE